jgi:hypothetical protein
LGEVQDVIDYLEGEPKIPAIFIHLFTNCGADATEYGG